MLWRRWTRSCSTRPAGICSRWMAWRTRGRGGRGAGWWSWEHRTSRCRTAPGMTASGTGGPACTRPARSSPRGRTPPAHTPSVQWTPPRMHDPRGRASACWGSHTRSRRRTRWVERTPPGSRTSARTAFGPRACCRSGPRDTASGRWTPPRRSGSGCSSRGRTIQPRTGRPAGT